MNGTNTRATSDQRPAPSGRPRTARVRFFRAVKRVAVVFAVVLVLLGAYLYFYASRQQEQLTERNFRALSSLSTQIGTSLQSAEQVLGQVDTNVHRTGAEWRSAAPFAPLYHNLVLRSAGVVDFEGEKAGRCTLLQPDSLHRAASQPLGGWRIDPGSLPHCLYRQIALTTKVGKKTKPDSALAILNLAEYLGPLLPRGVFHKTVVADDSGMVLIQAGLPELPLTSLSAVIPQPRKDSIASGWHDLRRKPSVTDVRLAGETYRLFLEPCCMTADGSYWNRDLIVAGLVPKESMVRESLRVSLSVVMICSAILILVFLGWPFLKLRLIGEREPVHLRDGMLLGVCSLLAVAMTTIFLLSLYSYTRSRADRDADLQALAREIVTNLKIEVAHAYRELHRLAAVQAPGVKADFPENPLIPISKDSLTFPFFESWSLINALGMQAVKWSTDSYIQRRVRVRDRDYFTELIQDRGWPGPPGTGSTGPAGSGGRTYYLEPTVSRTTGKRQVALSIRTGDAVYPVASMALEMVSLINVVLPRGYGFAVVDSDSGKVLLHSDPTRNLDERFFTETDQNRKLLSAIVARTADTLNLKYGGADYRAHVTPVPGLPWSLVTFLDKQPGRITNAEWLGTSTFLILIYGLLLGIFAGTTLLFFPGYRAPWVWPDRRFHDGYVRLAVVNGLFLLAFLIAVTRLAGDDLLLAGFVLPLQAMTAAWACLVHHRHAPRQSSAVARSAVALGLYLVLALAFLYSDASGVIHWTVTLLAAAGSLLALYPRPWLRAFNSREQPRARSIELPYVTAAVLFLLVTGMMPAAAFFTVARTAHGEMLVKRGQLSLARGMAEREKRVRQAYSDELGSGKNAARKIRLCARMEQPESDLCELDLYYRFYFGTRVLAETEAIGETPRSRVASSELVRLFLVPYRPQSSVEWRGMLPQLAHDSTWSWARVEGGLEFRGSAVPGGTTLRMSSLAPSFWPVRPSERLGGALLGVAVLILAGGIARFLARRFFLIDVTDPVLIPRQPRISSVGGTNLLVVCPENFEQSKVPPFAEKQVIDLAKEKFLLSGDRRTLLTRVSEHEPVVVRHFEYHHGDAKWTKAKLDLLEAVVSETGRSLLVLAERGEDKAALGLREAWQLAAVPRSHSRGNQSSRHDGSASVLESLVLVDLRRWERGWTDCDRRSLDLEDKPSPAELLIQAESRCDPNLGEIWQGLKEAIQRRPADRAEPTREELLDLLGERAESYYRTIWESCHTGERVVLVNLAHHGLVNDKDRRVLRRLLARGLIRRRPHFAVMNETFRRYLLSHHHEVQPDIPSGADSPWDSVRRPVLAIVASLAILLFVTQQELFSATSAIITALATGVASFSRISGLFDSRRGSGTGSG